ncbi:MAG: MgtC/SapB family protein [Eisenbergiella sp.]
MVCKGKRGDFYGVFELILRIGLSILLGFFIGLERQITGHPAGIRTNVLISMGACLFMMFPLMSGTDEVYRIASYIISGVGFLCSGVIFKESGTVRGLNTAATLWCTAAVGVLSSSVIICLLTAAVC